MPPLLFSLGLIEYGATAGRLVRIAAASGAAFLAAQLLDVTVFNRLRRQSWWRAPVFASLAGSVLDTAIFFSVAFAALFAFVGPEDAFALEPAPLLGVFGVEASRWISWALGDLSREAADRGLRADPLPADRRALEPAGAGLSSFSPFTERCPKGG